MVSYNGPPPSAYAPTPVVNSDGSLLVDTEDGTFAFVPGFSAATIAGTGIGLSQSNLNPYGTWQTTGGVAALNALLVELRVANQLLLWQMGANAPDINQMRADELFNCTLGTGAI